MTQDRRHHPRLIPDSALLVSVDKLRRAFLCDLSEGGIAFDGLVAEGGPSVVSLAFELPERGGLIEAIAEIVWTCEARHRTGARFIQLAEASRRHLREWLAARVVALDRGEESAGLPGSLNEIPDTAGSWPIPEISGQEISGAEAAEQIPGSASEVETFRRIAAAARPRISYSGVARVLGLAAVCAAFVTLGYYLPRMVPGPKIGTVSTAVAPVQPSLGGAVTRVSQQSASSAAPANFQGFVLQVGAMARRENADALAESLRRKSFPAFVFDRGGDGLYRVDVGPYPDAGYARGVRDDLKSAGFRNVLERQIGH